ncbi:molybdopterin cofactor-binding domain-containing protein [Actinomadura yumaensis]|uniref:molybdopterin cofactor-binding domain-containing protein n=1 Tax=Actinomadura yumaensis TaxID=111807 RepID=UPI0036151F2A
MVVPDAGSAFGGKHTGEAAVEAARLARAVRQPVKVLWTRAEEFTWGYLRPAAVVDVGAGARTDGTLTAWEFSCRNAGAEGLLSPYHVEHQRVEYQPSRSPLRQGPYRALAATANHFARETHMDELARTMEVDPLELRQRNLRDPRLLAVLNAAADAFGWEGASGGPTAASVSRWAGRRAATSPPARRWPWTRRRGTSRWNASCRSSSAARSSTPTT